MFAKSKALIFCLMLCIGLLLPFESKASNTYYVDYSQPSTSDNQGYLILEVERSNGTRFIDVFFWSLSATSNLRDGVDVLNTSMKITIQSNSNIVFEPVVPGSYSYGWKQISSYTDTGQVVIRSNGANLGSYTFNGYSGVNWKIVGWQYYGNIASVYSSVGTVGSSFDVVFNSNESAKKLQSIYEQLLISNSNDVQMINKLNSIMNSTMSIDDKLSYLTDLQEESNTWLEKIFNLLEDAPEEEKKQASTQGGNSVSEGTNAIEDKGQGFINSLNGLVSSMSYNGTDCSWTFPTVKLPAISGVMSETTLIQSQDINFGMWINAIPSDIMLLIRSVLTMGLIVYCFKEFYDTISYVLTLRGSDNE